MVEVVRLDRNSAPKKQGVDYVKRKHKTETTHSYAHEAIRKEKFDRSAKENVHHKLESGTSFWQVVSDEDWEKIFPKKK